jgi:hypothetical protein
MASGAWDRTAFIVYSIACVNGAKNVSVDDFHFFRVDKTSAQVLKYNPGVLMKMDEYAKR